VLGQLLAFLGVAAVVICVPGPDTALTVRNALAGGRRPGGATAAGVATGQAAWTLATTIGIAELVQASGPMGPGRAFRQGVVSNLANPKMAAFFLSLLPQFADPGAGGCWPWGWCSAC
jgi:threonine/homoserine/homoserine lactone efflux protein